MASQIQLRVEQRFWKYVDKKDSEECWEWTGALFSTGYGALGVESGFTGFDRRRMILVHRLSWRIHNGFIPEGLLVLHKCDNKKCVNSDHLYLGTHSDNLQDAWNRRQRRR